ncbi:alpha-(1,3)-fucosyltransferase 11-like [Clytia hemisphaerica]
MNCNASLAQKKSRLLHLPNHKEPSNKKDNISRFLGNINNYPTLNDPRYVIQNGRHPTIIWWTNSFYPHDEKDTILQCPRGPCHVTSNREYYWSNTTRAFVFYGTSFRANDLPLPRLPHHEWALIHEESPKNNWILSDPLGISVFNHTATFRRESDYPLTTHFIRDVDEWFDEEYYVTTADKNRFQKKEGLGIAVYVQRDCEPPSDRDAYVRELMKHIKIDSYGPCVNNKKMPREINGFVKLSSEKYYHFLAKYKFQIAFENCRCKDYMTEKVFRPLCIGSVPVYLGSKEARDLMPSNKSIIMVDDFESPKDLADFLIAVNANDTLYEEYLQHRKTKTITNPKLLNILKNQPWKLLHKNYKTNFGHYMFSGYTCYVCDQLHLRNQNLKQHLKDRNKHPIMPPHVADQSHLGCSLPVRTIQRPNEDHYYKQTVYNYGNEEAKALVQMLQANETDTKTFERKYLKRKTDRYP